MSLIGRMFSLDIETTGGSDVKIISIGFAWSTGARCRYLVNPGRRIVPAAMRVHGIRDADVVDAPTFAVLAPLVVEHICRSRARGDELATYNGPSFDIPILRRELHDAFVPIWAVDLDNAIDVLPWARTLGLKDKGGHSLTNVCRHLGVKAGGHQADADAEATIAVANKLIERRMMPLNFGAALAGPGKASERGQ